MTKLKYLGSDLALDDEGDLMVKDGDIDIIEDTACLRANLMDRMLTSEGDLLLHLDFGAGLMDRISSPMSRTSRDSLAVEVKHEILNDPRVREVTKVDIQESGRIVYIRVNLITIDDQIIGNLVFPFELEMTT
jgi:phage baseplate assembly protein W